MSGSEGTMAAARRVFAPAGSTHVHGHTDRPAPGHRHESGIPHHAHGVNPSGRAAAARPLRPGLSLLRLSLGMRLAIAALAIAAIWAAVVAVMQ